jgi:hypothetical protein
MRKIIALAGALALALAYATAARAAQDSTSLSIDIIPAVAASNCPTTPPPQAAAAGFTKLAYCLDGASAFTANLNNWLSCPDTTATAPAWWAGSNDSGRTCQQLFSQVTDPISGKTVLDLHWPGTGSLFTMATCLTCAPGGSPASATDHEWSVGHYTEFRVRLTPLPAAGRPHGYGPALFEWTNQKASGSGQPGTDLGPIEIDTLEMNGGDGNGSDSDMAVHDWGMANLGGGLATGAVGASTITVTNLTGATPVPFAPPQHPMCIDGPGIPHRTLFTWTVAGTSPLTITLANTDWIAYTAGTLPVALDNTPITWGYCSSGYAVGQYNSFNINVMHTYGTLQTTDGATYIQQCGFADDTLAPVFGAGGYGFPNNCGEWDLTYEKFHLVQPHYLIFWGGTPGNPTPTDELIEYIAVWECPNGYPDGPDPTCSGPKMLPSTIEMVR